MKQITALIPIADGNEEIETISLIDVLRRAGIKVTVAGITQKQIVAANGTHVVADDLLDAHKSGDFDLVVLPGGDRGAAAFRDHAPLIQLLREQKASGRWFGAICASPALVLATHGLIDGMQATCYPTYQDKMQKAHYVKHPVVVDKNCITSTGPATAMAFALKCVEVLCGKPKSDEISQALLLS